MNLTVWQDAEALFKLTCSGFRNFAFELKKLAAQQISYRLTSSKRLTPSLTRLRTGWSGWLKVYNKKRIRS